MATTKGQYQAAPQRDSMDGYTQAPPSYQAEGISNTTSTNPGTYGAGPRDSDDNIPDDFKVSTFSHPYSHHKREHQTNNTITVWRIRLRSHPRHPHAIHPQSLLNPHRANPLHSPRLLSLLLQRLLPHMDPDPPRHDVGIALRRHRVHAVDLLETQELSH